MDVASLSQTKEQQVEAVGPQRAALKEEMGRERAALAALQRQQVDSARARAVQWQFGVQE